MPCDIHVERLCNPFLGDASFHRLHDHLVFLDDREAIDALVVGEGLVVGGNQASDFGLAHILENVDTKMTIEKQILARLAPVARDNRRLDNADLSNGSGDLRVFRCLLDRRRDELERLDIGNRNSLAGLFERHLHRCIRGFCEPSNACTPSLDTIRNVARQGVETLSPQQRHEVLVGEELAQRLGHEHQAISGRLGLTDQEPLVVDILLIGPKESI